MSLEINIENKLSTFNLKANFTQNNGILGLIGASGCGKSMTLKCISGLITPSKGKIVVNNKVLFDSDKKINLSPQKRKVGYVFQNYALFPNMTVTKNIQAGLFNLDSHEKNELTNYYIKKLNLEGLENHFPHELSGGQMQRVALARTLVTKPDVLLLDEPFSALDTHLRSTLERDLKEILKDYDGIVIFVTHDISEAYRFCDDLIVYEKGLSLPKRNKEDLFSYPNNLTEANLTGCKNISAARKTSTNTIYASDFGYNFKVTGCVPDTINHIGIQSHNIKVISHISYNDKSNKYDEFAEPQIDDTSLSLSANSYKFKIINMIENPFTYKLILKNPSDDFAASLEIEAAKSDCNYKINDVLLLDFPSENIFYF